MSAGAGFAGAGAGTAYLALEDGTVFRGQSVGAEGVSFGEAVFATAMTGYQELVTDPSYAEQILCFTAPMVGNYGVCKSRSESAGPHVKGVVMREAQGPAWTDWLRENGIVAVDGIDTRSLVLHLRDRGAMWAAIGTGDEIPAVEGAMEGQALVAQVSTPEPYVYAEHGRLRVAVVDYGTKQSILRRLAGASVAVTVYPHTVDADELAGYDGVVLSNGPGDPEPLEDEAAVVRDLLGRVPVFGICLGHQLLGVATDHETFKLPFGHRGANHPVLERAIGPRARHLAEPRVRGRADRGLRGDGDLALRRHRRGLRLPGAERALGAVPPGGRPGAARRLAAPRDVGGGAVRDPASAELTSSRSA